MTLVGDSARRFRNLLALLIVVPVVATACTPLPDWAGDHPHGAEAPQDGVTRPPDSGTTVLPPQGLFSTICRGTHVSQDDPIVFPLQDEHGHAHTFAGSTNPDVDETSTSESIVGHGTTCRRDQDESAYWAPTLIQREEPVPAHQVLVYYRTGGIRDSATIVPMPSGMKMIAGNTLASDPQDLDVVSWGCVGTQSIDSAFEDIPTDCPGGIRLKIKFPNCWNGSDLDSVNHQDHVAYSWEEDGNRRVCPASHPVPIPEVELSFHYAVEGYDDLSLSSGGTYSGHADFMNGWDPDEMAHLTDVCLNVPVKCGNTGDGVES